MASLNLFTVVMLVVSSLNSIFPSIFSLGLINSSFPPPSPSPSPSPSPLPSSPSASPSPLKDDDIGFVARLIHRTFPQSPFYNPLANQEDLMAKDIHISQQRSMYFSQLTTITKGETNMMVRAPMMSNNFLMKFSIGTPPQQTFAVPDTGKSPISKTPDQKNTPNALQPLDIQYPTSQQQSPCNTQIIPATGQLLISPQTSMQTTLQRTPDQFNSIIYNHHLASSNSGKTCDDYILHPANGSSGITYNHHPAKVKDSSAMNPVLSVLST
ncbi:putative uncharacterized protein DDB_G0290521 [Camellia sinensis]|uniref:putative uncharacterized protein DDB_G0290521 n=1 Tax=Camellia sinensis TaxID=4442 RepID=UPI001036A85D|nr:putative uncharacterized protein DDB_G0290521 [Camellia sinensis]